MLDMSAAPEHAMKPSVSVCITTFNHDRYIEDCIRSVLSQQLDGEIEVLVGNDASPDDTDTVVRRLLVDHGERVRYFSHKTNLGPSANLQFLVAEARGKFIAHLDGDDYWLPGKLQQQLTFLKNHPDCAAVYTNAIVTDPGNRLLGVFNNELPEEFDLPFLLARGNFLNHSSILYRSSLKGAILEISSAFIDYRVHLRLSAYGRIGYINSALVGYRYLVSSSMTRRSLETVWALNWEAVLEACRNARSTGVAVSGTAAMISWAITTSIGTSSLKFGLRWLHRIRHEMPGQLFRSALVRGACLVVTGAMRSLKRRIAGRLNSSGLRIFYPR